jgi:hypothetical protein
MDQEPTVLRRLWRGLVQLAFYVAVGIVTVALALWTVDRDPTMEAISVQAPKAVRPGGQLEVAYRVNRFRICDRQVFREIIDGAGNRHILGIQPNPVPSPRGFDAYTSLVAVPLTVQPGEGEYRVAIEDYCNPLHYLWPLRTFIEVPIIIAITPGQAVEN